MNQFYNAAKSNQLFEGITQSEFVAILTCLSARVSSYAGGDRVLLSGDQVNSLGLILSGNIRITREDIRGNVTILAKLGPPETFAEALVCAEVSQSPVTVQATEDTEILHIDYGKIFVACDNDCSCHEQMIKNMTKLLAQKNLLLNRKIEVLSKRTTREKILCLLDHQKTQSKKIILHLNREEMANYLCVDRSALSSELSKMRDDGLIRYERNKFEIV